MCVQTIFPTLPTTQLYRQHNKFARVAVTNDSNGVSLLFARFANVNELKIRPNP